MSMYDGTPQPRGHWKNKGSFTGTPDHAPEASLATVTPIFGDFDGETEVNNDFPEPQANSLEKVTTVVDAVNAGANTAEAIAEALDVSNREGSYYGDAAGYLGLVELIPGDGPKEYALTSLGQKILASDDQDRAGLMKDLVAGTPAVQVYADGGRNDLLDYMNAAGLGDSTAERRASTAVTWFTSANYDPEFETHVAGESTFTRGRAAVAAANAVEAKRLRIETARAITPKHGSSCTSCGMQTPLSGVCDFC